MTENTCLTLSNNGSIVINPNSLSVPTLYPFEIFNKILDKGLTINAIEPRNMRIKEIDSSRDLFE